MSDQVDIHTVLNLPPQFTQEATASNITRTSMTISAIATDDGIGGELTYTFYWGTSESNLSRVTSNTTGTFPKNGLTHSTTYYYRIDAYDGIETTTGTVGHTSTSINHAPSAPSVSVSKVSSSTSQLKITTKSTDSDNDTLTYTIIRGSSSSNITTTRGSSSGNSGSTVTITDTGLSKNTTYYYKVKVTDGYGGEATSTSYGSQRTYCLGTYCSGGSYTYPTCGTCNGDKTITCPECTNGYNPCTDSRCKNGKIISSYTCPTCDRIGPLCEILPVNHGL